MTRLPGILTSLFGVTVLVLSLSSLAPSSVPAPAGPPLSPEAAAREVVALASAPALSRALEAVDLQREALVEEWIALASTPSSSGQEGARAVLVEKAFREADLESVRRDAAGNVIGILPGRDRKAGAAVFMAHMDTVAPPGADFTARRRGDRLHGPGVRDDSSGLAALLAAARIAKKSGIIPPTDVIFVASVKEEIGLHGSRAFMDAAGGRVGSFVAVDGYLGQVSYAATSILWLKIHFRAEGAHTLSSHEHPSATLAAARAIVALEGIHLPRAPEREESWLNVGMLGGGEVPNAQARDAWFTVDLRSNSRVVSRELEEKILEACDRAARDVGVRLEIETLQRLEGASLEGHRRSRIVQTARAALDFLGWHMVLLTPRGTADHNIAIQRGIPAIALGVTTGDGAHTPEEYADIPPYATGLKQLLILIASPLS